MRLLCLLLGWMLAAAPGCCAEAARAPLPPIDHFFDNAAFSGALLSPDARSLAAKIGRPGRRDALAVIDLATRRARVVAEFSDADIGDFQWVNDERLLYAVGEKHLARADLEHGGGLYAVNRDGEGFRQLAKRSLSRVSEHTVGNLLDWTTEMLDQPGAQDSQFVYVTSASYERGQFRHVDLLRLDTVSGRATTVQRPAGAADWLLDQRGEPRIVTAIERDQAVVYHRAGDQWRKLAAANAYTGAGGDKAALYRFDLATAKRAAEPLVALHDSTSRATSSLPTTSCSACACSPMRAPPSGSTAP